MAQTDYELEVLLELREQARDEAQDQVAHELAELERRRQAVRAAEAALAAAERRRHEQCEAFDVSCRAGDVGIGQIQQFGDFVRGMKQDERELAEKIDVARGRVASQQRAVERAKANLIEAATELEAVESHRTQWEQEQKLLRQRKESSAMDEIAARLWRSQNE